MPRNTERYPAINPPGLEPDRKPPVTPEAGATQTTPEGGPSQPLQPEAGAPTPEPAAAREELSVEKLKAELFGREVPEEYKRIIAEFPGFHASDPVSPLMLGLPVNGEAMRSFLQKKLRGSTLFDLGCGTGSSPVGMKIAKEYETGRYVGVDLYSNHPYAERSEGGTESYIVAREDMLGFVSRMKDKVGGAYLISGIQLYPWLPGKGIDVKEWKRRQTAYCDALAAEMSRTLNPGDVSIIVTMGDTYDFLQDLGPEKYGFRKMDFRPDQGRKESIVDDTRVYERIGEREAKKS